MSTFIKKTKDKSLKLGHEFPESLEKIFNEKNNYGRDLLRKVRAYLKKQPDIDMLSAFNPLIFYFEHIFSKEVKASVNTEIYDCIMPITMFSYNLYLDLIQSYKNMSLSGVALIGRSAFEASLSTRYMLSDPHRLPLQYYDYRHVHTLRWKLRNHEINSTDFKNTIRDKYHVWFDEDYEILKKKSKSWTALESYSIEVISNKCGLEIEYDKFYRTFSQFVHVQPNIINMYNVSRAPICKVEYLKEPTLLSYEYFSDTLINIYKLLKLKNLKDIEALSGLPIFALG